MRNNLDAQQKLNSHLRIPFIFMELNYSILTCLIEITYVPICAICIQTQYIWTVK